MLVARVTWVLLGCVLTARAACGSGMTVRLRIPGARAPQGVSTEVCLPSGWRPGDQALLMVFLHDGRGTERSFHRHGLDAVLGALERNGLAPRTVVACPRYRGTYLVDSPRAEMETYLAEDFVPAVERAFPGAGGSRERRVVWGISMGGYGALKLALRHPGVFGRAAALAPWVQRLSWAAYARHRGLLGRWLIEPVFGRSAAESRFEANDLVTIAREADPRAAPPLYVRTGSADRWEPGALELVALLRARGFAIDAASIPGAHHAWADWLRAAPALFRFLAGGAAAAAP